MYPTETPRLIQIDPYLIKFNPFNPRKHQGLEYARLKQSLNATGPIQMPTVRTLSGGFYECIDGEGRIKAAQEARHSTIWVINLGLISDQEAFAMLQASNVVRSFSFLAECKGLATLHRQGNTAENIARNLGFSPGYIMNAISVGYFPYQIFTLIEEDMAKPSPAKRESRTISWSAVTLITLLPLRIQIKEGLPGIDLSYDGLYDYTEVRHAVEKIICGDITSREQLNTYIEQRRRELFEQHFDRDLQQRLKDELAQAKQALQEAHSQHLQQVETQTVKRYEAQVETLRKRYSELEKSHQTAISKIAKHPEIIASREKELQQKLQETEAERLALLSRQQKVQEEAEQKLQQFQQEMKYHLQDAIKQQQAAQEQILAKTRADLEAYYSQKDHERQLKAEKTVRQSIAYGVELLAQSQQWILHLTSPDFIKTLPWLQEPEIIGLLAQIRTVRESLDKAEEKIRQRGFTPVEGSVVSNQNGQHVSPSLHKSGY